LENIENKLIAKEAENGVLLKKIADIEGLLSKD